MELRLPPETEAKLNELARRTHKATDRLPGEAVDYLVEYNDWFERKVRAGIEDPEGGRAAPNEEDAAWLERRERR
jgi:predicted transcriptional regulator